MPSVTKIRRGTTAGWTKLESSGKYLENGQLGYNKDTKELKIGTGATPFADLPNIMAGVNINASGILKATAGVVSSAVAGTDYPDPAIYTSTSIASASSPLTSAHTESLKVIKKDSPLPFLSIGTFNNNAYLTTSGNSNTDIQFNLMNAMYYITRSGEFYANGKTVENAELKPTLGSAAYPWNNLYVSEIRNVDSNGPELFIKKTQCGPGEYGWTFGSKLGDTDKSGLSISRVDDNACRIGMYAASIVLDSRYYATFAFSSVKVLSVKWNPVGTTKILNFAPDSSETEAHLGESGKSWKSLFIGDMIMQYNAEEQAIEFVAE